MVKIYSNQDYLNSSRVINHPRAINPNDLVIKQDLDDALISLSGVSISIPTDLDASSNPDFPESKPGQSYYITAAGTVGGVDVNIGDQLICKAENGSQGGGAAVASDFFFLEANRSQATETELGVAKIASQSQVNDGNNNTDIVTPLKLQTKLNSAFNSRKYSTAIGDGTSNSYVITHSLNDNNPIVTIRESFSPFMQVVADIAYLDPNNIQISFINPIPTNSMTVIIKS